MQIIPLNPIGSRRSIVELVGRGCLDAQLAALLWLTVEGRIPLLVADPGSPGAGLLRAILGSFAEPDAPLDPALDSDPAAAVAAIQEGRGRGATIAADSLEGLLRALRAAPFRLSDDAIARLGVVLVVEPVAPRVAAAHYLRPVRLGADGRLDRRGPAVLAAWDDLAARFDHFDWGVTSDLAERVGLPPSVFEAELERRAAHLTALIDAGTSGLAAARRAIDAYRLAIARAHRH